MRALVRDVRGAELDERMTTPAAPLRDDRRVVLVVAILASFVVGLDASVVNVALPAIRHELGGGLVVQQWVVDAYMVTLGRSSSSRGRSRTCSDGCGSSRSG